jgi:hypothetical protein
MKRRAWHRATFTAAATYNILWGIYALVDPQWFFRFAGLPPLNHPGIFAGLGVVVGAFGVVYAEVARHPERGFSLAAAGTVAKALGLASLGSIARGEWPPAAIVLSLTNDIIWLVPFSLYLYDAWPAWRRSATTRAPPLPP